MHKFVINQELLEQWCSSHNVTVPEVRIVDHIPYGDAGDHPFGDYTHSHHDPHDAVIRVRLALPYKSRKYIPRRLSDKKRVTICKVMNLTLFHELRHHMQVQTMHAFYVAGKVGEYNSRPIEKDARSYAARALRQQKPIIQLITTEGR